MNTSSNPIECVNICSECPTRAAFDVLMANELWRARIGRTLLHAADSVVQATTEYAEARDAAVFDEGFDPNGPRTQRFDTIRPPVKMVEDQQAAEDEQRQILQEVVGHEQQAAAHRGERDATSCSDGVRRWGLAGILVVRKCRSEQAPVLQRWSVGRS